MSGHWCGGVGSGQGGEGRAEPDRSRPGRAGAQRGVPDVRFWFFHDSNPPRKDTPMRTTEQFIKARLGVLALA